MKHRWLSCCYRFALVFVLSVIIEILYFNRINLLAIINGQETSYSGEYITENQKGEIFVNSEDMKIYNVVVSCDSNSVLSFSYLKPNGIVETVPMFESGKNEFSLKLGKDVVGTTVIRGDYNEKKVSDILVIYNKRTLMVSPCRVIAMIIIYYIGKILFSLQKMPDYGKLLAQQ